MLFTLNLSALWSDLVGGYNTLRRINQNLRAFVCKKLPAF